MRRRPDLCGPRSPKRAMERDTRPRRHVHHARLPVRGASPRKWQRLLQLRMPYRQGTRPRARPHRPLCANGGRSRPSGRTHASATGRRTPAGARTGADASTRSDAIATCAHAGTDASAATGTDAGTSRGEKAVASSRSRHNNDTACATATHRSASTLHCTLPRRRRRQCRGRNCCQRPYRTCAGTKPACSADATARGTPAA